MLGYLKGSTDSLTDVQTNSVAGPASFNNTVGTSNFGTTAAVYKNVKPADFGDLQHRFIDTSPLKKPSRKECQQTLPAKAKPPTMEEAARKALVAAFSERESSRARLNTNYSLDGALEFDERAKIYNVRRERLAALMPGKTLSIEDERSFPLLSTKDTVEPQVCESILTFH